MDDQVKTANKEAMKRLREQRKPLIEAAAARMKEQNAIIKAIQEQLRDEPRTVPELAEATGLPSSRILWTIASMKKYGQVMEAEQDDAYFRYQLAASAPAA
jgi:predicted Rossmann fold nucleotide-binding protein DprA/Smf involved in DNA uptake